MTHISNENLYETLNNEEIEARKRVEELKISMEADGIPFEPEPGQKQLKRQIELEKAVIDLQAAIYANWRGRGCPNQFSTLLLLNRIKQRMKTSDPQIHINEIESTNRVKELKKSMEDDGIPFEPEPGQKKLKRQIELENAIKDQQEAIYINWHDKVGTNSIYNLLMSHKLKTNQ